MIHADFETRSTFDLLKGGIYNYAAHPTTDVNCLAYAFDGGDVELWLPGEDPPSELLYHLKQGEHFGAWNAQFERLIWNNVMPRHGFPTIPLSQFYCVAALSRARGYPGGLDKAARFAGIPQLKDKEGHYLMLKLCKPRSMEYGNVPVWWDDPRDYERLAEYCRQDVKVERALFHTFIPFTDSELTDYHISEEINDRGVMIDTKLASHAIWFAEKEHIDNDRALTILTKGWVTAHTQVEKIKSWVATQWKPVEDLSKGTIIDLLDESDIPDNVKQVLEIRSGQAKAAVSKYQAMLDRKSIDDYLRGLFMFRGAGQTGRYSSTGAQVHNTMAETFPEAIPFMLEDNHAALKMLDDPVTILAKLVRPTFIASPGKVFLIGDYAQIEARITAWLAGETELLQLFRSGVSPYSSFGEAVTCRKISKTETPKEYKVFKACVLGLGFGGGEGALARSLKKEGIDVPIDERKALVAAYRGKYTRITQGLWPALRDAVLLAMYSPGAMFPVGPVNYLFDGEHLWCRLPSGRLMCYPFARIVQDDYGDCVEYRRGNRSPKAGVQEWPVVRLWYGLLTENLAQAIAYDLLAGALRRLRGECVRIHVHDEIVDEVDEEEPDEVLEDFLATMAAGEDWSEGLPIMAEGKISRRYTK
jgi:DNA polymerase